MKQSHQRRQAHGSDDSAVAQLLAEIERLEVSQHAKDAFRQVLRSMVGQRVHMSKRVLVVPHQVDLTIRLLEQGMARADVQRALRQRANVSKEKAYRLVRVALCERQIPLFEEARQDG